MTDTPIAIEVNCETGEVVERPLTSKEIADAKAQADAAAEAQAVRDAEEARRRHGLGDDLQVRHRLAGVHHRVHVLPVLLQVAAGLPQDRPGQVRGGHDVVAAVAEQPLRFRQFGKQRCRTGVVADPPGHHEEAQGAAVGIGNGMEFRIHAALGASDQAPEIPLFTARLDAVRCAFK